jgi:hypothetical protein
MDVVFKKKKYNDRSNTQLFSQIIEVVSYVW